MYLRLQSILRLAPCIFILACSAGNPKRDLMGLPAFRESIAAASHISVFQGLPHPTWDAELLESELRSSFHVDKNGYPFYQTPVFLSDTDRSEAVSIFGMEGAFRPFSGDKLCGGFHPDLALEWESDGSKFEALVCLGCSEIQLHGEKQYIWVDLSKSTEDRFRMLLKRNESALNEARKVLASSK